MNDIQKIILAVGVTILIMLLYPPYVIHSAGNNASTIIMTGYDWLFALPYRATVDVLTLITQWIGVMIIGGLAVFYLKNKNN